MFVLHTVFLLALTTVNGNWEVTVPPSVERDGESSGPTEKTAGQQFLQEHLDQLLEFKNDELFRRVAFGVGHKYHAWQAEVERHRDDPRFSFGERVAVGDLITLGLEYAKTQGADNEYTRFARSELAKVIGLQATVRDLPPRTPRTKDSHEDSPRGMISRQDLGDDWPLTVERGILDCIPPSVAVVRVGDTVYALNGLAISAGYRRINPIWRENPSIPGTKINIGPLTQRALELCR